ncbi:MAG: UvrD-helicase domain-containing protein [Pseudomonadota bacterium]
MTAAVKAAAVARLDERELHALAASFAVGGPKAQGLAPPLAAAVAAQDPVARFDHLAQVAMTQQGNPRTAERLITKTMQKAEPATLLRFEAMRATVVAAQGALLAMSAAERARDLGTFAAHYLRAFEAAKAGAGLLDFDDMIARTAALLTRAEMAAWVLYKLDGGLDHILVDEAQDTAPAQWQVIGALADEFFAGEGAREGATPRTLFVVGDEKQSIYSFQGADPQVFGSMRGRTADRLTALGTPMAAPALDTSFRSAPGILEYVDAVFAAEAGAGLTLDGAPPRHVASRQGDAATIELWEPVLKEATPEPPPWYAPVDVPSPADPRLRLARTLAAEIARMLRQGECLPPRDGKAGRAIGPGDILVLVRRRDLLARALVAALKAEGVPVAGADRLLLSKSLAVQDLMAALRVAALPDDDLSLAALLRSPLGGVSEEGLLSLAAGRTPGERLSQRLATQAAEYPQAAALIADLTAKAGFLPPYEMLERVLIHHGGRARLQARLGAEAEDAIDELLSQALLYEGQGAPSLTGFIAWFDAAEVTVKREMEGAAGMVRVMTVHGAKGLEAPLVILPDTTGPAVTRPPGAPLLLTVPGGGNAQDLVLWAGSRGADDALTAEARAARERREIAEHKRLLYVALTRAESRLILCAAGDPDRGSEPKAGEAEGDEASLLKADKKAAIWYRMLREGMAAMEAVPGEPPPGITGLSRIGPVPQRLGRMDAATPTALTPGSALPAWAGPAPPEARAPRISPSRLVPHEAPQAAVAQTVAFAPADPKAYGLAVHALLEHGPTRDADARAIALAAAPKLTEPAILAAMREAAAARALPQAAALFAPGAVAEASLVIPVPPEHRARAGARMTGRVDRLLITPQAIVVADIKSDRGVPVNADGVPADYLAQLGAYAGALEAVYPDRALRVCLLWTAEPRLMALDVEECKKAFTQALGSLP